MTAYIHIGTPKTGTTTIQHFLANNRNELLKNNLCYLNYKGSLDHWFIPKLLDTLWKKSNKSLDIFYKNKHIFLDYQEEIQIIKKEVEKLNSKQAVLLSCEGIYQLCSSFEFLTIFKEILHFIGISNIKIIVYFRRPADYFIAYYTQSIKGANSNYANIFLKNPNEDIHFMIKYQLQYSKIMEIYSTIFKQDNLIIKSYDKNKFFNNNLIDDFLSIFQITQNPSFKQANNKNKSLDILGVNICNILYENINFANLIIQKNLVSSFTTIMEKFFSTRSNFLPKKSIYINYNKFYDEEIKKIETKYLNNQELFSTINLNNYKENWHIEKIDNDDFKQIILFFQEIITLILNNQKENIDPNAQNEIKKLQDIINSISFKKTTLELANLEQDLIIKKLQSKKLAKSLGIKINMDYSRVIFIQTNSAIQRIQNHLAYKLGQVIIDNSKSLWGYIRMFYVLSYIKDKHKKEQVGYQNSIKDNPNLILPPLETYPDYNEALKLKNSFTYKLGQALIQANKNWYRGGVYQVFSSRCA
ncbi:hypothetical protein IRA69_06340 [Campylobacter hepaticus]|uniref:hypothetical protein n=2 Tax=Campylobacter hepaticus TaxID=1813019 RepID=UPI0018C034B5|nr:hypothetical protein [Campylobacter hepaticus]MDX2333307.1 hypothetical protein [Campylobacter hepaticus]QOW63618.1 hypothetical protein IRA69_06340 [Campylobacter hepaticus]